MDLNAAKLADYRAVRLARAGMLACFVVASVMLIASLAVAKGVAPTFDASTFASINPLD